MVRFSGEYIMHYLEDQETELVNSIYNIKEKISALISECEGKIHSGIGWRTLKELVIFRAEEIGEEAHNFPCDSFDDFVDSVDKDFFHREDWQECKAMLVDGLNDMMASSLSYLDSELDQVRACMPSDYEEHNTHWGL